MIKPRYHPAPAPLPNAYPRHELPSIAKEESSFVTCRIREELSCLQEVGGEAEETSQAGARYGHSLAGTVNCWAAWGWAAGWGCGDADCPSRGGGQRGGGRDDRRSGVVEHWGAGWGSAGGKS